MTEEDVIKFFREKRNLRPSDELDDLGKEILEAAKRVYVAGFIGSGREYYISVDLYFKDLSKSHLRKDSNGNITFIRVISTVDKTFCVDTKLSDLIRYGEAQIERWNNEDEETIDKLMLEIGKVQESIDRRNQKWDKFIKSRL